MRRRTTAATALLLAFLVAVSSGCAGLPHEGSVRTVRVSDSGRDTDTLVDYTPAGPEPGGAPLTLVDGFLDAMTATPLNTYVARQYLTGASGRAWVPERGTVSYGSAELTAGRGGRVEVRLRQLVELDARGAWLGDPSGGRGQDLHLRLVKEGGQWRISHPPNRLLVPRAHFESQYQQNLLYFFDRSAQVLVPEPVFVPRGRQTPTLLMAGLLRGPEPFLRRVDRTFFPPGAALDGISVPVSADGTAEVSLSHQVLDVDNGQLRRLFAQIAWTLRQVSGVSRVRVTVGGSPVDLPGAPQGFGVGDWASVDPAVASAATTPFGLRGGRVVSLGSDGERPVSGAAGTVPLGLRSFAVDLGGRLVAGVADHGRRALVSDRDASPGAAATRADVHTVYGRGTDLLRPAYDLYGQLWLVDRTRAGARVLVVRDGSLRTVAAPGIAGRRVVRFVLSRDGTRLVAQVRSGGRDRLLIARVQRDTRGRVEALAAPSRLTVEGDPARVRDLAWRSPTRLAVLVGHSPDSRVLIAMVDGSSGRQLDLDIDPFPGSATRLVSSPTSGTQLFLGSPDGEFFALSRGGHWTHSSIRRGLTALTFAG